jgi:hypothetical protein
LARATVSFNHDVHQCDGTKAQFGYLSNDVKFKVLNIFFVFDVHSKKILGASFNENENTSMVLSALESSVKLTGVLPFELQFDGGSFTKTDEFKEFAKKAKLLGCTIRVLPGNPQQRQQERYWGAMESQVWRYMPGYIPSPKGRKELKLSKQLIRRSIKRENLPDREGLIIKILEGIEKWNSLSTDKRKSPNEVMSNEPAPNAIRLEPYQIHQLFWLRKSVTVKRHMVKIVVDKQAHEYYITDYELRDRLFEQKVTVCYDNDLSSVSLFTPDTDEFICMLERHIRPQGALATQTPEDLAIIERYKATERGYHVHQKKNLAAYQERAFRDVEEVPAELLDPLRDSKDEIQEAELRQFRSYFMDQYDIDPSTVKPVRELKAVDFNDFYRTKKKVKKEPYVKGSLKEIKI